MVGAQNGRGDGKAARCGALIRTGTTTTNNKANINNQIRSLVARNCIVEDEDEVSERTFGTKTIADLHLIGGRGSSPAIRDLTTLTGHSLSHCQQIHAAVLNPANHNNDNNISQQKTALGFWRMLSNVECSVRPQDVQRRLEDDSDGPFQPTTYPDPRSCKRDCN